MSGDCEGPEVLRRRIQEQNKLIELLTQRNSELGERLHRQQQQQEQQSGRTPRGSRSVQQIRLQETSDQLQLQETSDQLQLLHRRFQVLSHNHDELTKIKDEYKTRNRTLQADNARLQHENEQLFSGELSRKQGELDLLRSQLEQSQQQQQHVRGRLGDAEQQRGRLSRQLETLRRSSSDTEAALRRRLEDAAQRQRLQAARGARLAAVCTTLQQRLRDAELHAQQERQEAEQRAFERERRCAQLTALASDRGRQVRQQDVQQEQLRQELADLQRRLAEHELRAQQERREALRDAEVARLGQQLTALRAEYDAYKRHATYLIEQERALNEKLRHFQVPRARPQTERTETERAKSETRTEPETETETETGTETGLDM